MKSIKMIIKVGNDINKIGPIEQGENHINPSFGYNEKVDSILSIENSVQKIKQLFPDIEDTDKLRQFIYAFPDSYIDILTELHLYLRSNKVSDNILDYIISKKGNLYELKLIYDKFGHWIDDNTVTLIFINKFTIYQAVLFAKYKSYVDEIVKAHNNFDFSLLERFFENNNKNVIYYVKEILDIQPDFKFDYLDPKFWEFNAYLESITKVPQILDMFVTNKGERSKNVDNRIYMKSRNNYTKIITKLRGFYKDKGKFDIFIQSIIQDNSTSDMLYSDKVQMISEIYKFFEIDSKIDQKIEKIENSPNSEVEILSLLGLPNSFKLQGKLVVKKIGIGLAVYTENNEDFEEIARKSAGFGANYEKGNAKGFMSLLFGGQDLQGHVFLVKGLDFKDNNDTAIHESEHCFNSIFLKKFKFQNSVIEKSLTTSSDEIIAHLKAGRSLKQIEKLFLNPEGNTYDNTKENTNFGFSKIDSLEVYEMWNSLVVYSIRLIGFLLENHPDFSIDSLYGLEIMNWEQLLKNYYKPNEIHKIVTKLKEETNNDCYFPWKLKLEWEIYSLKLDKEAKTKVNEVLLPMSGHGNKEFYKKTKDLYLSLFL